MLAATLVGFLDAVAAQDGRDAGDQFMVARAGFVLVKFRQDFGPEFVSEASL